MRMTRRTKIVPFVQALAATAFLASGLQAQERDAGDVAAEAREIGEAGRIVGRVLSADDASPLSSARVILEGTSMGGGSGIAGRYVIRNVPAGAYDLRVELLGYATKTVTGVSVRPGETTVLDVRLSPRAVELSGITVTAAAERGSTTSLLNERRTSMVVSDAVGSEQMSRSPDGDAAAALKRVPGLTVVDGKYAYVRGLGERYSATSLNGSPLASPVPDRKVIPLDLFPSSLLESIVTSKSYSPDQPGDHAGGLVELRTRDFPPNRVLSVSGGTSWSSEATFATGLGHDAGAGLDFLGLPGAGRALPAAVPRDRRVTAATMSPSELEAVGESFAGDFGPVARTLPVNSTLSVAYGDDFDMDDDARIGFLASASYANGFTFRNGQVERVFRGSEVDDPDVDYRGDLTTHSVRWGGLISATFQPAAHSLLSVTGIYNRMADDLARVFEGFNLDKNTNQRNSRLQYVATETRNLQVEGEHGLGFLADARLEWRGAWTRAGRFEPNTREVLYQQVGDLFVFDDFVQSGSVFHQDQSDDGYSGGMKLSVPFRTGRRDGSVQVGASTDRKDRGTYTRRFRFRPDRSAGSMLTTEILALPPNELLVPQHIAPNGFQLEESTFRTDNYAASQHVDAAFVTLDVQPLPGLRVSGGARVERLAQTVTPFDLFETGLDPIEGAAVDETDLLPAMNLTWAVAENVNLRGSISRTLARPHLRELSPFGFADYAGGFLVLGNPGLERTRIRNLDVRWEWFPRGDAVVAVSGFHKEFDGPIEEMVLPSTEPIRSWVNAPGATNRGVEMEVRSGLGFVSRSLERLAVNGNLTLIDSEIDLGEDVTAYIPGSGVSRISIPQRPRGLEGQSPYVVNLGFTWHDPRTGLSASVLFNRYGERIDAVGAQRAPDIVEEARSTLDVVVERPFGSFDLKLAAGRLIGGEVSFTQDGELLRRYDTGRTISLGVGWRPLD